MIIFTKADTRDQARYSAEDFFDRLGPATEFYESIEGLEDEERDAAIEHYFNERSYPELWDWYSLGGRWDDYFLNCKISMIYGGKAYTNYLDYVCTNYKHVYDYVSQSYRFSASSQPIIKDIKQEIETIRKPLIDKFFPNLEYRLPFLDINSVTEEERNCVPAYEAMPMLFLHNLRQTHKLISNSLISLSKNKPISFSLPEQEDIDIEYHIDCDTWYWNIETNSTYLPFYENDDNYWAVLFDYHY